MVYENPLSLPTLTEYAASQIEGASFEEVIRCIIEALLATLETDL